MKLIYLFIVLLAVPYAELVSQEGNNNANERFVGVTKGNQDAVVLGAPDFISEDVKCVLGINDKVTLLDSTEGAYVKIRTKCDGNVIEGWVKKLILRKERVEADSGVASSMGASASSTGSKGIIGYETPDLSGAKRDTVEPPWDKIDLVGYRMKPGLPVDITPEKEGIPPWVYIGGGALTGGGITYLITKEEDGSSPKPLMVNDDQYTVPCNTGRTLDVLANDSGEDLVILSAEGPAGLSFNPDFLEVSGLLSDAIITYTVEDASNNTAGGTVFVSVTFPGISAGDDVYETEFETALQGNVLGNDAGEGLEAAVLAEPVSGQLTFSPDGNFTYEPQSGFSGEDQFQYRITDRCGQQEQAMVRITVGQAPCDFNVVVETSPAHCGLSDGEAAVTIDPQGAYTIEWSDGSTDEDRIDLAEGTYGLTVNDENGCEEFVEVEIGALPADYNVSAVVDPATCIGGGEITVSISSPGPGPMVIKIQGPQETVEFTRPAGSAIQVSEEINIVPGDYTISVWDETAGEECTESTTVTVRDETPLLQAMDDQYTLTAGASVNGNVLDNDEGLFLRVIGYTEPASGTLTLNGDGSFVYQSVSDPPDQVTFDYDVRDTCGNEAQATVIMEINRCTFDAGFETTDAACGLSDGSVVITVEPAGNYEINWSDGTGGTVLENVSAGTYRVTVVDSEADCTLEFETVVGELPADYNLELSSSPATCIGDGNVIISFVNPGEGPLVIELTGPDGMIEFTAPNGEDVSLAEQMNVLPGEYTINVWDETAGPDCAEGAVITVPEQSPPPVARDDDYMTGPSQVLSEDVLDNDEGLSIEVIDHTEPATGILVLNPDGSFQYVPDGTGGAPVTFEYTIQDTCGQKDTALVSIEFIQCTFDAGFETNDASCGISDGSATITLDPPGNYEINWSDGSTGTFLENVPAGTYQVTVTDVALGCFLEFETTIGELPADYIEDVTVIQPECGAPGDIILELVSQGSGPFLIEVTHPNGTDTYSQGGPGVFTLSEEMEVVPGVYNIIIRDISLPAQCTQEITVTLEPSPVPHILLEGIIPPSSESSNDGSITVFIDLFTLPPFQVVINGIPSGQVNGEVFTIAELPAGVYEIFIVDAEGCQSNNLVVELFPGTGLTAIESGWSMEQPPSFTFPTSVEHPPAPADVLSMPIVSFQFSGVQDIVSPWGSLRYGNTGLSNTSRPTGYELFNIQFGIERTMDFRNLRMKPRMGLSYEAWTMHTGTDDLRQKYWRPVLEAQAEWSLFRRFRMYSRSSVKGIQRVAWSLEFGLKTDID